MSCAGTGPFALQFGSLLDGESCSAQMHRRPKMSGGAALFPDAADTSSARGSHARRRSRTFREDRSRKQQHNPKYAKQERQVTSKKFYQEAASPTSNSALKRRESLTKKRVEAVKDNSLEVAMGFCGSVSQAFESVKSDSKGEIVATSQPERMDEDMDTVTQASGSGEGRMAPPMYGENAVEDLYATLREYLQVETKFQPNPVLPVNPQRGEISAGTRDGAAHVLRCLKIWYDLPTDVLCHAINLLDRFLTKMKVRPCHVSCISVSCMNMAIVSHRPQLPTINTEDLVSISQCKCTVGDVRRMSAVIGEKLGAVGESITPLHWLRLLIRLFHWAAPSLVQAVPSLMQETDMINRLEILSCDASCCTIRSCELALVLLCTQLDSQLTILQRSPSVQNSDRMAELTRLVHFAVELQRVCQIGDESFYTSHQAVVNVLERYNARQKTPHRQRLVWRVSSRTLKVLRPTDRLTSMLPTIEEQHSSTHPSETANRLRSGSESSDDLSEESEDWPTSPLVPVICNDN